MGRIRSGALRPGEWLPTDRELLREFPVSRTALREALIILECLGLTESHHGVGCRVVGRAPRTRLGRDVSVNLVALLEACRVFETEAAGLAASLDGDGPSPIPTILSAAGPMTTKVCQRLHVALARATGNTVIAASIQNLWDLAATRPALHIPLDMALAHADRRIHELQNQVVDAFARRSPPAARQAADALFGGYLAAVCELEDQKPPARAPFDETQDRRSTAGDR
ncbi:MAG TPA: GntR family transcriptional regulator [Caulobacter sp.]|nr:GntR family transcriptional regulator [Caulobacter sp.]